jgi:type IV pilus assembly protein PilQ
MNGAQVWMTVFALSLAAEAAWAQEPRVAADPQAEDPKAKAVREAYEEQLQRERQEITIKVRNATVDQIVDEFRRQTGRNIVLDKKNVPEDYRVDEFIVEKEMFSTALEAFLAKAELSSEQVSPTLLMLSRPPRLTFNFRDADIKVVVDMIARVSGANLIVAPDVKGTITLSINNVPWNEVLDAVVKTLNFTTVKENFGIIRIIHPDELLKQMETRVFPIRYITLPSVYQARVEQTKTLFGQPLQAPASIQELMDRFVLRQVLGTVLSRNATGQIIGKLDFDPQQSIFVVRDTKIVLDKVGEIIKLLDVEPEQVILDLKFVSTTNRDLLEFGVNWSFGGADGFQTSTRMLNPTFFTTPQGEDVSGKITKLPFGLGRETGGVGQDQLFLTNWDGTLLFRAFKQDQFSRILQEPTLAVVDNTEAAIFVGETISYAEVRTTTNQFGGLEFSLGEAQKSPVKVGFQLFVLPKIISEANRVILTVIPQNEVLSGPSTGAAVPGFVRFTLVSNGADQSIDLPRISQTQLISRLVVESGRTAVLGGLVVERTTYQDQGIPVLKDIPLINYLFKRRSDDVTKEHLLIFLTPRIVRRGRGSSEALQELLKIREEQERREFEESRKRGGAQPQK